METAWRRRPAGVVEKNPLLAWTATVAWGPMAGGSFRPRTAGDQRKRKQDSQKRAPQTPAQPICAVGRCGSMTKRACATATTNRSTRVSQHPRLAAAAHLYNPTVLAGRCAPAPLSRALPGHRGGKGRRHQVRADPVISARWV